jgi:RNA polymerase sigma-70 factor (ECF subfamily)
MLSMVRRYISHSEQAEEVLQNGFLRAFKKMDTFAFQGSFEGWLRRIVFNAISDYVKQNTQYREKVVLAEKEQSINETAAGRLQYKELLKLVQGLPESTRNVFNMFVIEGFSHKEIAERLKISEGTSKWHVSEGRRLLKEKIEQLY